MGDKLVLKDGTEIENAKLAPSSNMQAYVSLPGTNLVGSVQMFSDPNKTEEMIFYYGVYKKTYKGFTQIGSVGINPDGQHVDLYMNGDNPSIETEYTVPEQYLPEEMRTKVTT